MVGPKKQDFWPRINILKEDCCILWIQCITVHQKVPKSTFKVDFLHQKLTLKVQFWHFLMNHNSSTDLKKNPLSMLNQLLILGQKSCFLRPNIFEILQPNWHYYTYIHHKTLESWSVVMFFVFSSHRQLKSLLSYRSLIMVFKCFAMKI